MKTKTEIIREQQRVGGTPYGDRSFWYFAFRNPESVISLVIILAFTALVVYGKWWLGW
jgi:hypothetical protein